MAALEARGITALFPIQKRVYDPAAAGRDLIGRARTGSGKTLAFSLPVIEKLLQARLLLPDIFHPSSLLSILSKCPLRSRLVLSLPLIQKSLPFHLGGSYAHQRNQAV